MSDSTETWRRCSACKQPIALGALYYVCSVSTCNRARTGLVFCDVGCWEVHLPGARHREAWAEERTAPREPSSPEAPEPAQPKRRLVRPAAAAKPAGEPVPREVLIVASRLKEYVRARSGMNTSDRVLGPLSEIVRGVCEEAIRSAEREGRKTLLDRDIPDYRGR